MKQLPPEDRGFPHVHLHKDAVAVLDRYVSAHKPEGVRSRAAAIHHMASELERLQQTVDSENQHWSWHAVKDRLRSLHFDGELLSRIHKALYEE